MQGHLIAPIPFTQKKITCNKGGLTVTLSTFYLRCLYVDGGASHCLFAQCSPAHSISDSTCLYVPALQCTSSICLTSPHLTLPTDLAPVSRFRTCLDQPAASTFLVLPFVHARSLPHQHFVTTCFILQRQQLLVAPAISWVNNAACRQTLYPLSPCRLPASAAPTPSSKQPWRKSPVCCFSLTGNGIGSSRTSLHPAAHRPW